MKLLKEERKPESEESQNIEEREIQISEIGGTD